MVRFTELDVGTFDGAILIVDIDGTITNDRTGIVDEPSRRHLRRLAERNDVYLSSNGPDKERARSLADSTGTRYLETSHQKPSARVLESIPGAPGRNIVVIGDKHLTDGRFAQRIGAQFVQVERLLHADDRLHIRALYALDDLYGVLAPLSSYLRLMRPLQWVKNLLVFAPIFFAGEALEAPVVFRVAVAAVVFCAVSSAMYVQNDIADREQDKKHPLKRFRPLASGVIGVRGAMRFSGVLFVIGAAGIALLPAIFPAMAAYVLLNVAYSYVFKHIAIVDVALVSSFYVLRIIAGGEAAPVYVSPWIILCVFFGALFIVIGKRRAEALRDARRKVLDSYALPALDHMLTASAMLAITSYGLYTVLGNQSPYAVYSTVFVVAAIFRLLNRMYQSDADAEYPEMLVLKDKMVLGLTGLWALYMVALFYVQ